MTHPVISKINNILVKVILLREMRVILKRISFSPNYKTSYGQSKAGHHRMKLSSTNLETLIHWLTRVLYAMFL